VVRTISEYITIGVSVKGMVHAIRPTGTLFCENETRIVAQTTGTWEAVTCKNCMKRKNRWQRD